MNLNRSRSKYKKFKYNGNYITHIGRSECIRDKNNILIKIGYKELKHLVYVREFDFTKISSNKSEKYGIERAIYRYVGRTDEDLGNRTAKWSYTNRRRNTNIGKFLKSIMDMNKFNTFKELNKYVMEHTNVLQRYDDKEMAKKLEMSLISINKRDGINHEYIICLNSKDCLVQVSKYGRFIFK